MLKIHKNILGVRIKTSKPLIFIKTTTCHIICSTFDINFDGQNHVDRERCERCWSPRATGSRLLSWVYTRPQDQHLIHACTLQTNISAKFLENIKRKHLYLCEYSYHSLLVLTSQSHVLQYGMLSYRLSKMIMDQFLGSHDHWIWQLIASSLCLEFCLSYFYSNSNGKGVK